MTVYESHSVPDIVEYLFNRKGKLSTVIKTRGRVFHFPENDQLKGAYELIRLLCTRNEMRKLLTGSKEVSLKKQLQYGFGISEEELTEEEPEE